MGDVGRDRLCARIIENAENIYVREQVDGRWGAYALTELPADVMLRHVRRWVASGVLPLALKEDRDG